MAMSVRSPVFDSVILLAGPVEQSTLGALLRSHNPQLNVHPATTAADVDALEPALLARARLVAFTTPVIVPPKVLDGLGYGAYNFHPGPPEYPGWAPAHFAIYDRALLFGATAHGMVERVDAGPIVGVEWFAVPPGETVHGLECLAYVALARLYWLLAEHLATRCEPLPEIDTQWSGRKSSRRTYAAMCDIRPDISKDELDRRVGAFGGEYFGISHTIKLHGYTFRLVKPEANNEPVAAQNQIATALLASARQPALQAAG